MIYRHTTLPYKVHGFYRKCNSNIAACNCGFGIQVEDDVLLIDRCGPNRNNLFYPLTIKLYKNGDINPGFKVLKLNDGNQYQVGLILNFICSVNHQVSKCTLLLNICLLTMYCCIYN